MPKDKFDNEEIVEALAKIGEPEPGYFAGTALYDVSHWQTTGKVISKHFAVAVDANMMAEYLNGTATYREQDGDTIT